MLWHVLLITTSICRRLFRLFWEASKKEQEYENIRIQHDAFHMSSPEKFRVCNRIERSMTCRVSGEGQAVAVLTSGGDSQGMNAAIRAMVRMALYAQAQVYAVYWGYQGLVDGGENIKEFFWDDVHAIIHKGGTIIGSARCKDFRTREGRRKAVRNLVSRGVTNLVVIGGDGSLTGASLLSREWKSLLEELVAAGEISEEMACEHSFLNIVGMVGSIDNDFCGTDMTIGADSALHRILESADAITTTAASHQRAFVLEVMGRNCGYLALMAGISCSADWICIPEWPMEDSWQEDLCNAVTRSRISGRLTTIVIVAEGAQDGYGKAISSNEIKELLSTKLQLDTRVTVLGHVQRGGTPSAFDRLLASRYGAEAALCVLESDEKSDAYVMCLCGSQIVKKPLYECVDQCNAIKQAYTERNFKKVLELRGRVFESNIEIFKRMRKMKPIEELNKSSRYRFALLNVGAPAGGINAANASFVKKALSDGHEVIGIEDGFEGLLQNRVHNMKWGDVSGWSAQGGSNLGVTRTTPDVNFDLISSRFKEHRVSALFIVGGFEAFSSVLQLHEARKKYDEFCMPMVLVPATISNNVPGCWISLGADTALNCIVESCDRLCQSASSSQHGVFVVETMGGKCGYLATMAGIAGAADSAYIPEEKFTMADLKHNIEHLKSKFENVRSQRGLILRTEHCNKNYSTDFISRLYQEEGKGLFVTKTCVLGHVQQGGTPSPFDRLSGTRYGIKAYAFLIEKIEANKDEFGFVVAKSSDTACVLGLIKNHSQFTPVIDLKDKTDFVNRLPKECWWMTVQPLLKVLANYQVAAYNREEEM